MLYLLPGSAGVRTAILYIANHSKAQQHINDPLSAPAQSDETSLGTSSRQKSSTIASVTPPTPDRDSRRSSNTNPFRQSHGTPKQASVTTTSTYPTPPPSASPRHSPRNSLGHRQEFLTSGTRPRRSSSLKERFPGDPSVRPLEQLAREKALADKARHVTKKHAVRPDSIDGLDDSGVGRYHHEGPYDATLFARNNSWKSSPVAAVAETNDEALKATPHDKIVDAVKGHHPLDGTAVFPPGTVDREGQEYNYTEGENMMVEENAPGGPYKRWPGLQYHPDDIKGKGEPSYSIEKALKNSSLGGKDGAVEMTTNKSRSGSAAYRSQAFDDENRLGRSGSLSNKLKRRVGSLKKKFKDDE